jgi:hypothetical protein
MNEKCSTFYDTKFGKSCCLNRRIKKGSLSCHALTHYGTTADDELLEVRAIALNDINH